MRRHYRLMIPGPVEVDPDVLARMSDPLTAHYGDRWVEIWNGTTQNIKTIMGTDGDVFLIVGSGHTGNDTVVHSLFSAGDHVLALDNGIFGHRLREIAEGHGLRVTPLTKPWGVPFRADDIHQATKNAPDLKAVLFAHGETSTGLANPVEELAKAAKRHDLMVVVDTIASLGGEPYRMDDWGVDVTVCASQKALEAPPGLAIIGLNGRAWAAIEKRQGPRGWLTDLRVWKRFAEEQGAFHPHPGTMPVNTVNALRASTQLIIDEGLETRWARHARIARVVRDSVRAMGLRVLADEEVASRNLTVVVAEGKFKPRALSEFLKEHYGMHVGLGLMDWAEKAVRVGHMGPNANLEAVVPFLVGLEQYLRQTGHDVPRGSCLAGLESLTIDD